MLGTVAAFAQKGNIGFVYPTGAQKGTVVEITVGGQNISRAKGILVSGEGVSGELIPDPNPKASGKKKGKKDIGEEDNLQLADQVRFRLTIDKDAALGIRDLRLVMENGLTNRLYFEIGELPNVLEDGKAALSATAEKLPVTFNGQIMRSDVDRFRFRASKGQQLVLKVSARVFVPYMADAVPGWFQPIIRLYGPSGKEVAFCDDYTYHVDPVLFYKVPESGYYEVEINDALYRGREDFSYRIDVGELPYVTSISPLGGPTGSSTTVALRGYNLRKTSVKVSSPKAGFIPVSGVSRSGLTSNTVLFEASGLSPVRKVQGLGLSRDTALDIRPGEVDEDVIGRSMEQHWYSFTVDKKGLFRLWVTARHLGAPTDIRMTLFDSMGRVVKDVDDSEDPDDYMTTHFADPDLTTMLQPGTYSVRLVESQGKAGEDYAYRFSVDRAEPDFSVHLEPSTVSVPEDGTGYFNVVLTRRQNFNGDVSINISGLPKGFVAKGTTIAQGQSRGLVTVTAPKGAEHKVLHPKVTATARKGDVTITREASAVESMMQAFYYTHLMPIDDFRLEVGPSQPFRMEVVKDWKGGRLILRRGTTVPLKVRIVRDPSFTAPVTVMLKSASGGIKAEAVVIPEGESEGVLEVLTKSGKGRRDILTQVVVSGVVKASSSRIAGKGRQAFVASVSACAPCLEVRIPGDGTK